MGICGESDSRKSKKKEIDENNMNGIIEGNVNENSIKNTNK